MLNITEKKLENATMELQVEVPVDKVEEGYREAFKKLQAVAKIDGFRKGKAPIEMVESRYGKEADREVAESLVKSVFFEAIEEKDIRPITMPRYTYESISRESPFLFKALFEVAPTVELGKYKGIAANEQVCEVTEANVQAEVDSIRERFASTEQKEEGEPLANGDLVVIRVKRIDDIDESEREKAEFKEYRIIVGKSKDESALDRYIIGMKVNEEKEVEVKYPKDYQIPDLAGQKVRYHVVIGEIQTVTLPTLDDEFAKQLGYESVDEFRTKTAEYLRKYVEERIKGDAKAQILKEIVEGSRYDIPESMILREMDNLFKKTNESVGGSAKNIEQFAAIMGMDPGAFASRLREEAERTIKTTLSLAEIVKTEELSVDENRYREVVENIAKRNNKTPEEIEEIIAGNGTKESIENELRLDAAMELIYDQGKIKKMKPISFEEFARTLGKN